MIYASRNGRQRERIYPVRKPGEILFFERYVDLAVFEGCRIVFRRERFAVRLLLKRPFEPVL